MGVMRMASAIDVKWVADLIPLLKDKVDTARLSAKPVEKTEKQRGA